MKGDTYVNRHYGTRLGRNCFTWKVVIDGEVVAKSGRSYRTEAALDAAIERVSKLLAMVETRQRMIRVA